MFEKKNSKRIKFEVSSLKSSMHFNLFSHFRFDSVYAEKKIW